MTLKTTKLPTEILLESGLLGEVCKSCKGRSKHLVSPVLNNLLVYERCEACHGTGLKFWRLLTPYCWADKRPPESIFDLQPVDKLTGILLPLILQAPGVGGCQMEATDTTYCARLYVHDVLYPHKGRTIPLSAESVEQALALVWAKVYG